jgi:hypothetical protein
MKLSANKFAYVTLGDVLVGVGEEETIAVGDAGQLN